MTNPATPAPTPSWANAVLAGALFAIDPSAVGGIVVRGAPGPVRDAWFAQLRARLPHSSPFKYAPLHITIDRLLGGLDLGATLAAGKPILERGILAAADGGVVVVAMAERWSAAEAALVALALDRGEILFERDGMRAALPSRFGLIAIDEGIDQTQRPPSAWLDRLAFEIDLNEIAVQDAVALDYSVEAISAARHQLPHLPSIDHRAITSLCAAAVKLGIGSLRAPLLALTVARLHATLGGRSTVDETDLAAAARFVFGPRATQLPDAPPQPETDAEEPERHENSSNQTDQQRDIPDARNDDAKLEDMIVTAASSAIPAGLLDSLQVRSASSTRDASGGQSGALRKAAQRGKSIGLRSTTLNSNARINILATLRTAAPWQKLRRHWAVEKSPRDRHILIRREDFRAHRFKQRSGSTIVFAVDASGSSAMHRLAEAKGAVETLLADCYVRRDHVALVSFRGIGTEVLLARSKSLARAKRSLAGLPGGGGTPLASGIDAAGIVALQARRTGDTPLIVLMTDGRANVTRSGNSGRAEAQDQAVLAARGVKAAGIDALLIDTSPQPSAFASKIAAEMGGRYVQLPYADAKSISHVIASERLSSQR